MDIHRGSGDALVLEPVRDKPAIGSLRKIFDVDSQHCKNAESTSKIKNLLCFACFLCVSLLMLWVWVCFLQVFAVVKLSACVKKVSLLGVWVSLPV